MKTLKGLSIPLLLGLLLMSTVAGVASARPDAKPQQQAWRVLTVEPSACVPLEETYDYHLGARDMVCQSGTCAFACPVHFPAAGEQAVGAVNVKRVTMYAKDSSSDDNTASFVMYKTHPATIAFLEMASGSATESPADPQAVMDTSIVGNPIYRVQGAVLAITITGPGPSIKVYGFYVHYTW